MNKIAISQQYGILYLWFLFIPCELLKVYLFEERKLYLHFVQPPKAGVLLEWRNCQNPDFFFQVGHKLLIFLNLV